MQLPTACRKAAELWNALEQILLGLLVCGMLVLAALQIVLRNFFQTGIAWIEPLLGTSVLWITMLGALAATGLTKHIKIDLVSHILPRRPRAAGAVLAHLFAATVCGLLLYSGARYVYFQKEMGGHLFLSVPAWALYTIMPIGFALIGLRFILHAAFAFAQTLSKNDAPKARMTGPPGPDDAPQMTPPAGGAS